MVDEQGVQNFLEIENAAIELIASLEAIKSETAHYSSASSSLDEARASFGPAAERFSALAVEFENLAKSFREIGMPALIESQVALGAAVDQKLGEIGKSFSLMESELSGLKIAVDDTSAQAAVFAGETVSGLQQVTEGAVTLSQKFDVEIAAMRSSIAAHDAEEVAAAGQTMNALGQIIEGTSAVSVKIEAGAKVTTDTLAQLRVLVLTALASTVVLGGVSLILLLVK